LSFIPTPLPSATVVRLTSGPAAPVTHGESVKLSVAPLIAPPLGTQMATPAVSSFVPPAKVLGPSASAPQLITVAALPGVRAPSRGPNRQASAKTRPHQGDLACVPPACPSAASVPEAPTVAAALSDGSAMHYKRPLADAVPMAITATVAASAVSTKAPTTVPTAEADSTPPVSPGSRAIAAIQEIVAEKVLFRSSLDGLIEQSGFFSPGTVEISSHAKMKTASPRAPANVQIHERRFVDPAMPADVSMNLYSKSFMNDSADQRRPLCGTPAKAGA